MTSRIAPLGATISLLGLLGWLVFSKPSGPELAAASADPSLSPIQQEEAGGSRVPCAVPLTWRIEAIDDQFGLTSEDARAAVQAAATLWEQAVGRGLFAEEPSAGLPVRFVYDERQANLLKRIDLQRAFDDEGRRLDDRRAELARAQASFDGTRTAYQERVSRFERQVSEHNAVVDRINRQGGAPDSVVKALAAEGETLQVERRELDGRQEELEASRQSLQEIADRLNQDVIDHGVKGEALERMFPPTRVEAGLYREAVQEQGGRVLAIQREIEIYRFAGPDDLRLVAAHELGHALGLGHSPSSGAMMSEERHGTAGIAEGGAILPSDLDLLTSRCPALTAPPRL